MNKTLIYLVLVCVVLVSGCIEQSDIWNIGVVEHNNSMIEAHENCFYLCKMECVKSCNQCFNIEISNCTDNECLCTSDLGSRVRNGD